MLSDFIAYRLAADPVLWAFWDGEPVLGEAVRDIDIVRDAELV